MRYGRFGSSRGKGGGGVIVVLGDRRRPPGRRLRRLFLRQADPGLRSRASGNSSPTPRRCSSPATRAASPARSRRSAATRSGPTLETHKAVGDQPFLLRPGIRLEFRRPLGDAPAARRADPRHRPQFDGKFFEPARGGRRGEGALVEGPAHAAGAARRLAAGRPGLRRGACGGGRNAVAGGRGAGAVDPGRDSRRASARRRARRTMRRS